MLLIKLISFTVFVLFPALLCATPSINSISGTFSGGETVTISGSGFGSKSPAAPLIWDDFEDGAIDTSTTALDRDDWDSIGSGWDDVDNTVKHAGTYSAKGDAGAGNCNACINGSYGDGVKVYVYLWRRYASTVSCNQKFFRMYPSETYPNWAWSWHNDGITIVEPNVWTTHGCCGSPPEGNTWYNEEFELQMSSGSAQADGIGRYYSNCTKESEFTDVVTRNGSYPDQFTRLYIDNYGEQTGYVWEDDIYIDTTWSRVMVGDNATFTSCTHREIQIPSVWADGEITITFNQGSFSTDDTAYVFVVDSNGDTCSGACGEEITIGGTSSPPQITGLTIRGGPLSEIPPEF